MERSNVRPLLLEKILRFISKWTKLCMRCDVTCHLTVRFGHMEQTLSAKPIPQETLKLSSPVRQKDVDWLFYRVMLHTREVDGREVCSSQIREELEKNVASEVQVKRFKLQEISGLQSAGNIHLPVCRRIDLKRGTHRTSSSTPSIPSARIAECGRRLRRRDTSSC